LCADEEREGFVIRSEMRAVFMSVSSPLPDNRCLSLISFYAVAGLFSPSKNSQVSDAAGAIATST
jgi:hypothetical protein